MENYFFMQPVLRLLRQGPVVYKVMAMLLRSAAALIVLGSLAAFFNAGKVIFGLPTTSAIMGGILYQIFFILAIYAVVHVLLIRARDIEDMMPTVGEVFMLPLGGCLVRTVGEVYAGFAFFCAIGGSIFVWFTSKHVALIMGPLAGFIPALGEVSFISGIEFMLSGILVSFGTIVASYMLAEILTLLSRAARNGHGHSQIPRQLPRHSQGHSLRRTG